MLETTLNSQNRRAFLGAFASATLATGMWPIGNLAEASLPNTLHRQEKDLAELYYLQDLTKAYQAFKDLNPPSKNFPSFEKFCSAVELCRQATCTIYIVNYNQIKASFSGFIVDIPENILGSSGIGKRYVITCDHARSTSINGEAIIALPDGTYVRPERQLVEKYGPNGTPIKDLRIYQFSANQLSGKKGLPLVNLINPMPIDLFALSYQPLNLRQTTTSSTSNGQLIITPDLAQKKPTEKFIVSRVVNSNAWDVAPDPSYPKNSGFLLDGYLNVGGSGAPVVVFGDKGFHVAGFQVSFVPETESVDKFSLEIKNDARIIHINNALDLMTVHKITK